MWLVPIGPPLWGVSWLGFLILGVVVAALLAASTPRRQGLPVTPEKGGTTEAVAVTLGLFFYLAIFLLLLGVVAGYVARARGVA